MNQYKKSIICSILLIAMGSTILAGWIFHVPIMIQFISGFVGMVFNTALCVTLFGIYFLLFNFEFPYKNIFQKSILFIVMIISMFSLSQNIFEYDLGIDRLFIIPWLEDLNPYPGRMAVNTSIVYILSASIGYLISYGHIRKVAIIIQSFTYIIFFIALTGFLIYTLKLEFIFGGYGYTRMSIPTTISFMVVSIAWYLIWSEMDWYKKLYKDDEGKRITFVMGVIFLGVTLTVGLVSISILTHQNILYIQRILKINFQNKVKVIVNSINSIENDVISVAHNDFLMDSLQNVNANNIKNLNKYTHPLMLKEFNAVQWLDKNGMSLVREGEYQPNPSIGVKLNTPYQSSLLWDKGFYFKFKVPVIKDNKLIGYFSGEAPLHELDEMYKDYEGLGSTGEVGICGLLNASSAQCFPMRLYPEAFNTSLIINDKPLPMFYALRGQAGIITTLDYRRINVISVYGPIGNLNLGMSVKMDTEEIYMPVRHQLFIVLFLAVIPIAIGLLLLYWQVVPLVRKVVSSERIANKNKKRLERNDKKLQHSNEELEKNIQKLNQRNKELLLLKELMSSLQPCLTLTEAAKFVSHYCQLLFPDVAGTLYFSQGIGSELKSASTWDFPLMQKKIMQPSECSAIKEKIENKLTSRELSSGCAHSEKIFKNSYNYFCIPIEIDKENMALLYLESKEGNENWSYHRILANALGEQLALEFSNINLKKTLLEQSIRDSLTGLYNRRYLEEWLDKELKVAARMKASCGIMMVDIDFFKNVNDNFGHEAGDVVLKSFASLFEKFIRPSDLVCRYGGEEFVIAMPSISLDIALRRAEELRNRAQMMKIEYDGKILDPITISIGVSMYPHHGLQLQDLIAASDTALYQAKNSGRNNVIAYNNP
ncbi:MAG: sensor domain-containing diguanylate cyclase [Gammaproteobacteria bacterium]|nr:sensor domain-containing diguanylate cyclase [Gammaproteobacteria bacterium]